MFRRLFIYNEKLKSDNRGLTLVEILCALAILALVSGIVGGVMIATSSNYRSGTKETAIQQEAQLAVNRIGDIIKDAVSVEFAGNTLDIKNGDDWYKVEFNSSENKLYYTQHVEADGVADATGVLAENISSFVVDTTNFKKNRTVQIGITVKDGEKTYELAYNMSARNEMTTDTTVGEVLRTASIMVENKVIMVPGESDLILNVQVKGCNKPLALECGPGLSAELTSNEELRLSLDKDFADEKTYIMLKTDDSDPPASVKVNVQVRRIKAVEVKYGYNQASGEKLESDSEYTFYGRIKDSTPYLSKAPGASWDAGYKNPRAISWELVLYDGTSICPDTKLAEYFEIINKVEDSDKPTITVKMKKPLDSNMYLEVIGQSMHANGVNKAGLAYDSTVKASAKLKPNLKISDNEISLDPTETGIVNLTMKGGSSTNIECKLVGNSDSSTKAVFNPSDGSVHITIGKNERGSGIIPNDPMKKFTFNVEVIDKNKGDKKSTITVHVKRVDRLSLQKEKDDDQTYTFTTKFNTDRNASISDVQNNSMYLINNKYNPYGVNRTPFTLAVVYCLEVVDNGKKIDLGYIVSRATCATESNAASNMWPGEFNAFKNDNGYVKWEAYPQSHSAQVTGEDTDDSKLLELPVLKLKLGNKKFEKITVTAIAFHALGAEKGKDYMSDALGIFANRDSYAVIKDKQEILGDQYRKINAPYLVIVEPNQGTDDFEPSEQEMVIPFTVNDPSITKVDVRTKYFGEGTRLSNYTNYSKDNPYVENAVEGKENDPRQGYLGLIIAKNEKGNNGIMEVELVGKDGDNNEVKAPITIALRRVNEIALAIKDKDTEDYIDNINKLNKAGGNITLEAYPKGFGNNGTEYFDIQKDNGDICRWEKKDHGEYKSPLPVKWTMEYKVNDKTVEKTLDDAQWKDYFESVDTPVTNDEKYSSSITFKLKKPLPNGAILRATSLHALGNDSGKQYNKSNKEYDKVVAELKIGNSYIRSPFARGEEYFFPGESVDDIITYSNKINQEKGEQTEARFYFRFYDYKTGIWSPYYATKENGNPQKFCSVESQVFLPDREYDIEIIKVVSDPNKKTIYWPKGLAGQAGTGFDGYTELTYESLDKYMESQIYPKCYHMGLSIPVFNGSYNLGSQTAPIKVTSGNTYEAKITDVIDLNMDKKGVQMKNYLIPMKIQKLENGKWTDIDVSVIKQQNNQYSWDIPQDDNANFRITVRNANSSGKYRIGVGVKAEVFMNASGTLKDVSYSSITSPSEFALYNENADTGFIYLQIN